MASDPRARSEKHMNRTVRDLRADAVGTVYIDRREDGFRFVVLRGRVSLCAYVGIPPTHPIADHHYDDLPIDAHGGLTYAGPSLIGVDSDLFWYGWDYAHAGDRLLYGFTDPSDGREWTPDLVDADSRHARDDFRKLLRLAEVLVRKAAEGAA